MASLLVVPGENVQKMSVYILIFPGWATALPEGCTSGVRGWLVGVRALVREVAVKGISLEARTWARILALPLHRSE